MCSVWNGHTAHLGGRKTRALNDARINFKLVGIKIIISKRQVVVVEWRPRVASRRDIPEAALPRVTILGGAKGRRAHCNAS